MVKFHVHISPFFSCRVTYTLIIIGNESNRTEEVPDFNVAYSWPNFDIAPRGSTFYTLNITIIPDRRLEDNELFRIYVDEPITPIGMMPIQVDVVILNDDGKSIH